jgi:hypothetical protein
MRLAEEPEDERWHEALLTYNESSSAQHNLAQLVSQRPEMQEEADAVGAANMGAADFEALVRDLYRAALLAQISDFGCVSLARCRGDVHAATVALLRRAPRLTTEDLVTDFVRMWRSYAKTRNSISDTGARGSDYASHYQLEMRKPKKCH